MFRLPKGRPLYENMGLSGLRLPDITAKLSFAKFTGYAHFVFSSAYVILVFESGKLVSLMTKEGENPPQKSGFEAMVDLARLITSAEHGTISVYQLSTDLTMCIQALLQGKALYRSQELALVDIKTLLARIKDNRMNGCLRIYTNERLAMIFYKDGNPLGFFNDGSETIETTPGDSQHIAKLPGAKLDLFTTVNPDELMALNLLEIIDVGQIWEAAQNSRKAAMHKLSKEQEGRQRLVREDRLSALEESVTAVCVDYLGDMGNKILEKELQAAGGNTCLRSVEEAAQLITALERGAKLLMVGQPRINKMKESISSVIEQAGIV
ncbi:GTPase-activating protein [Geobacter sp. FeAm09]|uniref:GTPase-activating protein n=1 Tax=Geobacter sp. FeAm09 TaxID=2597769 RepID=UPI0011ED565F|nr:GTPase-activating protein [Geobacter sp. FeAm09]QEM68369.1 GTPase-activating protein [Geobacter sp. FeAm09]